MRIFLTGATGFIGGHVADRLLARGDELVILARDPANARRLADACHEELRQFTLGDGISPDN